MRYDMILWDFDGTLVDTSPGIMSSIRYTCAQLGKPEPDEKTIRKFIGPPLEFSFREYTHYPPELAKEATNVYRTHYTGEALYDCSVYPGLPALLNEICIRGGKNAVTTLKPEFMAKRLLKHFDLERFFAACRGVDTEKKEQPTKAGLIRLVLEMLDIQDKARAVLIGDTIFDEQGARDSGVDFIAAGYGFGFEERPDCVFYAENVESLGKFLL